MIIKGRNYNWVIMGASAWISGKPSIKKIVEENAGKATIMVVERDGKKTFVLGAGYSGNGGYGNVGEEKTYIKDTGNGYGGTGYIKIENYITIDEKGIVDPGNGIGVNEKRPLYVFK
jgi:hypothetical protein